MCAGGEQFYGQHVLHNSFLWVDLIIIKWGAYFSGSYYGVSDNNYYGSSISGCFHRFTEQAFTVPLYCKNAFTILLHKILLFIIEVQ